MLFIIIVLTVDREEKCPSNTSRLGADLALVSSRVMNTDVSYV